MDFLILGALEVVDDGRPVAVSAGKQQALLGLLLVHANETLSTDRLIDELWGARPPATAAKTLQVHVSRLRKTLANGDGTDGPLVTRERGYQLKLDPERLDAHRFERLAAEGRTELAAGRPERAAATLERALALWRGPALGDLTGEPFAQRSAARLGELRIGALEDLFEAQLALGRHAEVLGRLDGLIAEHPYRERLRAQKMLALYRGDRQADALQVYQDTRVRLVSDLGIEPGERLRRLEQAVLAQDPELALRPPARPELPPELETRTPLIGRDPELERLREQWRRARAGAGRIVLLTGEHGSGKTRLAAELAEEVHLGGGEVRYDCGDGAADRARALLADGWSRLLVLDDVADLDGLAEAVREHPVLVVATAPRALPGALLTLRLPPLDAQAVAAVARGYGAEPAAERLVAASGGIPGQVHRLARAWAQQATSRRLGVSAERAAEERSSLRATESRLAGEVVELRALDEPAGAGRVVACPFKGLASFDIDDADVFYGRERLVAELVARLVGAPLLGIVGPSGSGKSSALRAGLLAALRAGVLPGSERRPVHAVRPGAHPPAALASVDARAVLAVDQFEELFTACGDPGERAEFVARLVERAAAAPSSLIIAVRADFYGRCAAYPELARLLAANHVLVGPMRRDELRAAIESPARRAGLSVEPALADALVNDVAGEPGGLPLLSTTLLELWRRRDGRRLRLSAYEHEGGVHGAVARLAESAYARLDEAQRVLARRMLLRLAGEGDGEAVVRRRVALGELVDERDGAATAVLAVLTESRLITVGEGQAEVAHEALLREWPRLRRWLDDDAQGRHLHRHLSDAAREWDGRGRDAGELYRGARLAATLDWAAGHPGELNSAESTFLDHSRRAAERSQRRLRAGLAGVAALLVLAVVAGLVALSERGTARAEAVAADAQKLGATALVENDFPRALLLARQGVALDDTTETRGSLIATLLKAPAAIGVMRAGDDERYWSAALSPDGRTLAAGDELGRLVLFDVRARRPLLTLDPLRDAERIASLVYSPDGSLLAFSSGSVDNVNQRVAVLDVRTRKLTANLGRLGGVVGVMRFSPDGRALLVEVADTSGPDPAESYLIPFDPRSGARLGHRVQVSPYPGLAWTTPDGRRLVVTDQAGTVIRDPTGRRALRRWPAGFDGQDFWTALSPDGRTLAAGGQDGSLHLLDLRTGRTRTASGSHGAPVSRGMVFTPDDRRVLTPGEDGRVIAWDVASGAEAETFSGHGGPVRALAVSADGRTLYSAGADGNVFIWDLGGARRLVRPFRAGGPSSTFPRYAISTDGRLLAHGQADGAVSIVDTRTLTVRRTFPVTTVGGATLDQFGHVAAVDGMQFIPRSHLLVVGGDRGFLAITDADTGRVLKRLRGHTGGVWTPGISADGRLMVTGSDDATVRLWSLPDGRPLGYPLSFAVAPIDTQLSPDGRWITVIDGGNTVQIIDARTRLPARRIAGAAFYAARFSPDGGLLAVGDMHGRARVYSTATWRPVTRAFTDHLGVVDSAAISADDRTLVTGAQDGTLRLWDIRTQQLLGAPLPGLPGQRVIPIFAPDGRALYAAYSSGNAYRWDIRTASLIRQACRVAGRRLTRAEWQRFLPGRGYDPAC